MTKFRPRYFIAVIVLLICALPVAANAATLVSEGANEELKTYEGIDQKVQVILEDSLSDHQAKVFEIVGEVWFQTSSSEDWQPLAKDQDIYEGDKIKTSAGAYAVISYDESFLNYVRIEEKTLMEFEALEPTVVRIEDGSVFNNLDGLLEGSFYETSTPTSVAAVRGTSFVRSYNASDGTDDTSVVTGTVEVAPVDFETGRAHKSARYEVKADHSLALDRKKVLSGNFESFKPKVMTQKRKEHLQLKRNQFEQRIEKDFPERAKRVREARKAFNNLKERPARMQTVLKKQGAGSRPAQLKMHQALANRDSKHQQFKQNKNRFAQDRKDAKKRKNNLRDKKQERFKERLERNSGNNHSPFQGRNGQNLDRVNNNKKQPGSNFKNRGKHRERAFTSHQKNNQKKNSNPQQKQKIQRKMKQ